MLPLVLPLRPVRRVVVATTVLTAVLSGGHVSAAGSTTPSPPSPASGHAEVIAQGIVGFQGSPYRWSAGEHEVPVEGTEFTADTATLLVAVTEPAVTVRGAEGTWSRLAPGEATMRFSGSTAVLTSDGGPARLTAISLEPAVEDQSDAFVPAAGEHDMDLIRDVLAPGEELTLTSELPAFVLVTSGSVTDAVGSSIASGASANLTGSISLSNAGPDVATVLVAVIGPLLTPDSTATTTTAAASTTPPTEPVGPDSTEAAPPALDPMGDEDGDGLLNGDEVGVWNTDPNDPDSDDDGHNDYREVVDFQTDPNDPNDQPSSPTTTAPPPDNDGDGLTNAEEAQLGTDPDSQDSDGDGISDSGEVLQGTDPLDVNDPGSG